MIALSIAGVDSVVRVPVFGLDDIAKISESSLAQLFDLELFQWKVSSKNAEAE
jgi:hypothetical protein